MANYIYDSKSPRTGVVQKKKAKIAELKQFEFILLNLESCPIPDSNYALCKPKLRELCHYLSKHYEMIVIGEQSENKIHQMVRELGIYYSIDRIISTQPTITCNPHIFSLHQMKFYEFIMHKILCTDPSRLALIGGNLDQEIYGANLAGITTYYVYEGINQRTDIYAKYEADSYQKLYRYF